MSASVLQRISAFNFVRDIPYEINLLDRAKDASCVSKAKRLQEKLKELGIESRRICCRFAWKETPVPAELYNLAGGPESGHEYLEVLIPETREWVPVDPTWDTSGLAAVGFPIAQWDGLHATILAVKPTKIDSPEDSAIITQTNDAASPNQWVSIHEAIGPFVDGFNNFLKSRRRAPGSPHAQTH